MPTICELRASERAALLLSSISAELCALVIERGAQSADKRKKSGEIKNVLHRCGRTTITFWCVCFVCAFADCLHSIHLTPHHAYVSVCGSIGSLWPFSLLMKCIYKLEVENGQMHFVRVRFFIGPVAPSGGDVCECTFGLLNCVKQTMRTLGHALIVNEYLCSRYARKSREINLRCYASETATALRRPFHERCKHEHHRSPSSMHSKYLSHWTHTHTHTHHIQ